MEIEKDKDYEIIVFPNQDEGLKAQRVLVTKNMDFKHISALAVAVSGKNRQNICRILVDNDVPISGYYRFLYRDYEEDFLNRAYAYKP